MGRALAQRLVGDGEQVRPRLPDIEVPALAVHRTGDRVLDVSHGRYLAEHLPNATYLEIPGRDHVPWGRDLDVIMAELEYFLTGRRPDESSRAAMHTIGLDLRVSVHVGPCEFYGDDLIGLTVNIAARILAEAEPGEILVSEAVQEQATGPSLTFSSRGRRPLKGVPGQWALFAVV